MPQSIQIAPVVMGIKARQDAAYKLAQELGCPVSIDDPPVSPWHNARGCWLSCPEWATHRLLVNDDALLCPGFLDAAHKAIAAQPDKIVSFFTTRPEILRAHDAGRSWLVYHRSICGVALCLPKAFTSEFVAWCDEYINPDWHSADARLFCWSHATDRPVHYTVPSLAQHDEQHESTIHGKARLGRVSPCFASQSAADIDWTLPPYDSARRPIPHYWQMHAQWFRSGLQLDEYGGPMSEAIKRCLSEDAPEPIVLMTMRQFRAYLQEAGVDCSQLPESWRL